MMRFIWIILAAFSLASTTALAQLEPSGGSGNALSNSGSSTSLSASSGSNSLVPSGDAPNTLSPSDSQRTAVGSSAATESDLAPSSQVAQRNGNVVEGVVADEGMTAQLAEGWSVLYGLVPIAVIGFVLFALIRRTQDDPRKAKKKNSASSGVSSTADFWQDYNVGDTSDAGD